LMSELEVAQVDTRFIVRDVEAQTGFALMCVAEGGRYVSYHIAGANLGLDASAVERALKGGSFDMVILQLEIPLETVYRTYELSKKNGVPVFLDAGPAMSIDLEPFKGLHIISPNEAETVAMSGIEPQTEADARDAAELLFERAGPRYVILKLGGRGAYFFDGADGRLIPAFVVNAIDSTAAGDTFNAALVTRLCRGDSIEHAITVAHAAAAICVSRKGALPSIPAEAEVDAFLRHEQASRRES